MEFKNVGVEYRCDACGKILRGYDKSILKKENYISIKGDVCLQLFDTDTDKASFWHIIPKGKPFITICDTDCLNTYINFQKIQYMQIRDRKLRDEAAGFSPDDKTSFPVHPYKPPYMKGKYDKRY